MKDKLLTKCSFSNAWETREGDRYPKSELGYIRAYIKDGRWWNTFFPVHWELNTPELVEEFMRGFAMNALITLHINLMYGKNTHHIIEAVFKSVGRALAESTEITGSAILSTKGVL